tara:strand:+ start:187385 stop:187852 length:468 start_codon:yes stop_codon:yes gene_type:complete
MLVEHKMKMEEITISSRRNGAIPWTRKDNSECGTVMAMQEKYHNFFAIFEQKPEGCHPNPSALDNSSVDEIIYHLLERADNLDQLWHMYQMKFVNTSTDEIFYLKLFNVIGRDTRRLEIPDNEGEKTLMMDMWGTRSLLLLAKHTRPLTMEDMTC